MDFKVNMPKIVSWCWLVLSAVAVALVCLAHFPEGSGWDTLLPLQGNYHIAMMLVGGAFVFALSWMIKKMCRKKTIRKSLFLAVSLLLCVVQVVAMYSYYFHTDWDVQLVTGTAKAMAEVQPYDYFYDYYHWNPNNLFLTRLFALVFFVTGPLWGANVTLFPLLVLQCAACWLSGVMLFQIAMHIWHRKSLAITAYSLFVLLVGFSPWWSIPYSDVWGLVMAVAILWTSIVAPSRRAWLRIFIVAMMTAVGYYVKPQTVLVGMSIAIMVVSKQYRRGERLKSLFRQSLIVFGGLLVGIMLAHISTIGCPLHLHSGKALGAPHYLMMGANRYSIGIYSAQDVDFSHSYVNKGKRRNAELKETWQRYSDMGFKGTVELWGRKNLLNFSDGTFYWGGEGDFYKIVPDRKGRLAGLTRSIYYNRSQMGDYYKAWSVAATSLWFGILLMTLIAALPRLIRKYKTDRDNNSSPTKEEDNSLMYIGIIMLALCFIVLFHTLCEARSRYFFSFTPFFVLLAIEGLRRVLHSDGLELDGSHVGGETETEEMC